MLSSRNQRNVRSSVVGSPEGRSPPFVVSLSNHGGGTVPTSRDQKPLSPFQKRKGDTGGWFGRWKITITSPIQGRQYGAVVRSQVPESSHAHRGMKLPKQPIMTPGHHAIVRLQRTEKLDEIRCPTCWTSYIGQTMIGQYVPSRLRSDQVIQAIQERYRLWP